MAGERTRDDGHRVEIQAILRELPEGHPALAAYQAGADPIALTRLVEREDLVEKLNQAWLDWYARKLRSRRKADAA